MELGGGRGRRGRLVVTARASILFWVSCCCCCFSICALLADAGRTTAHLGISCGRGKHFPMQSVPLAAAAAAAQHGDGATAVVGPWRKRRMAMVSTTRRYLVGPGSYPPRCTSKCGDCTPCKPVHVPVPPGTPVITEYYPEAWRCKCGGKLYMP